MEDRPAQFTFHRFSLDGELMKGLIVSAVLMFAAGGFARNVCAEERLSESTSSKAYCNNLCQRSLIEQYYAKIN